MVAALLASCAERATLWRFVVYAYYIMVLCYVGKLHDSRLPLRSGGGI
jgi:hypothetical protein